MKPDEAAASIQSTIKAAAACGRRCRIVGGGSKPWLAHASAAGSTEAEVLATKALSGIVEYEPTELVIVVRGGTPVAEVEQAMAEAGQMLAFEPPTADGRATIGGTLASAASGPRRAYAGAVRDFVLGVELIDGKGDRLRFGGKVMKNVAGFDISRLVCGSAGTLGVITEVAFKCLPLPKATETRVYELDMTAAIRAMNRWYAEADPISATTWVDGKLHVRFSGAEPAVQAALARRGGEPLADANRWWADWREQRHPFFAQPGQVMRMSCRATVEPIEGLTQAIEWGGALRWLHAPSEEDRARVRYWTHRAKGYATRWHAPFSEMLEELAPEVRALTARLKAEFDPYGVFPSVARVE